MRQKIAWHQRRTKTRAMPQMLQLVRFKVRFFLSVESSIDSCVLDSGVSFHTTTHHEIMKNYVAKNYGNVYIADGEPLYIVSFGYICLKISNKAM